MAGDRPAWVIVGVDRPDGVMLLASTELTEAELTSEVERDRDYFGLFDPYRVAFERRRHILTVEMRQFVMVYANTYEEAFGNLFTQWRPESHRPAEVAGASRALPSVRTNEEDPDA